MLNVAGALQRSWGPGMGIILGGLVGSLRGFMCTRNSSSELGSVPVYLYFYTATSTDLQL